MHSMNPPTPNRFLPLCGVAYTVLMVAAAVAFPMAPGGDVSPASHPAWLQEHTNAVIAQGYVRALAALAFIGLSVAIASACRGRLDAASALPRAALVGGSLSGVLLLLGQAVALAAALFARSGGGADATRALAALQNGFLDMSAIPATVLFAATGLAALRTSLLPRWLAVASVAGVPLALLDAASYDGGPLESLGMLGLVYFLAWSLLTAVRLHLGSLDRAAPAGEPTLVADMR